MPKLTHTDHGNITQLKDQLKSIPDYERISRIGFIQFSKSMFDANTRELVEKIQWAMIPLNFYQLWEWHNRPYLYEFQLDVIRLLHNFITSAKTLVDHTRRYYRDNYEKVGEFSDFETETKARFSNNLAIQFIHDLRNYYQHFSPTTVGVSLNPPRNGVTRHKIYLNKRDLLKWSEWKSKSKQFLKTSEEQIELLYLIQDYISAVNSFHSWIHKRLIEIHQSDLKSINEIEHKIGRILSKEYPERIKEIFKLLENRGGTPEDIFSNIVPHNIFVEVKNITSWQERLHRFLVEIQNERKLPSKLVKDIERRFIEYYAQINNLD